LQTCFTDTFDHPKLQKKKAEADLDNLLRPKELAVKLLSRHWIGEKGLLTKEKLPAMKGSHRREQHPG
jgi:hypothetical protein